MLSLSRAFFQKKGVLEVDVPLLTQKAPIDLHIDLIQAVCSGKSCYLQSSPEYPMKRLLAEGIGDIYQLSHVFRDGECGGRHNPEFSMVEWYRHGFSFGKMIEETVEFIRLFLPFVSSVDYVTYDEVFAPYATSSQDKDYIMAFEIEPKLGVEKFTILTDFPPEQAALAKVIEKEGKKVAERFEIFYQGMELANGYHEVTSAREVEQRCITANQQRRALQKPVYPIDTYLIEALEKGIPDMCGVACGFDRLLMLQLKATHISEVLPFSWDLV